MKKKHISAFLLALYISACIPLENYQQKSGFSPFWISNVNIEKIGETKVIVGKTMSIPPTLLKKVVSREYRIEFFVNVSRNVIWDSMIYTTVEYDYEKKVILFNEEKRRLPNARQIKYHFEVSVKEDDELDLEFGYFGANGAPVKTYFSVMGLN